MTLPTRRLGRTERQVTLFGLGGQAAIQWTPEGVDPTDIIRKAHRLGVNYFDTSNVYGPSQANFGEAFRQLHIGATGPARERLFIASKTHFRSQRRPAGERFRSDYSEGMMDDFKTKNAVDDVKRSLSLMFGDGKGQYPLGAYLDCIQFHNLNTFDEVDMLFEGFDDPSPERPWLGALAAMVDLRDGTNYTGCNPNYEVLVKHIGITGHWNSAAHLYAIQRDQRRVIDTLLVTVNPGDKHFFAHRHNAIAAAQAADMGVIGMKIFADAAYYHKDAKFSTAVEDVYREVGSSELPSDELIQYALSVNGVATVIVGIGQISDDSSRCQLSANIEASKTNLPLDEKTMAAIEERLLVADKAGGNRYFQREKIGLTAARKVGAEWECSQPKMGRRAVRISWHTAYAGEYAIECYEIFAGEQSVAKLPYQAQIDALGFCYTHALSEGEEAPEYYKIRTHDSGGHHVDSPQVAVEV